MNLPTKEIIENGITLTVCGNGSPACTKIEYIEFFDTFSDVAWLIIGGVKYINTNFDKTSRGTLGIFTTEAVSK